MKKKSIKKRLAIIAAVLILVLIGISFGGGMYLVNYAIGRSGDGGNRTVALEIPETASEIEKKIIEEKIAQEEANDDFLENHPGEMIEIEASDGITCKGAYYENGDAHDWVIALHGYRGDHFGATALAQHYYDHGYQVLTPDLRACGESDGEYIGMGWLDRNDILEWIQWIIDKDPNAEIVIHGISMGAATTMMTAGEETPSQVVAFVEDCGYTSVWDIFSSELKLRFHMPEFPLLYTSNMIANFKAGYDFKEASALKQIENCDKPMLFIHGTADDFIPYEMMDILYQAKPGDNKEQVTAEGAGHGDAMYALGEEYWDSVFSFLEQY